MSKNINFDIIRKYIIPTTIKHVVYFLSFLFHLLNVKYILKEKDIISVGRVLSNFDWIILAALIFIFTNKYLDVFIISLIIKVLFIVFIGWMFFYKR